MALKSLAGPAPAGKTLLSVHHDSSSFPPRREQSESSLLASCFGSGEAQTRHNRGEAAAAAPPALAACEAPRASQGQGSSPYARIHERGNRGTAGLQEERGAWVWPSSCRALRGGASTVFGSARCSGLAPSTSRGPRAGPAPGASLPDPSGMRCPPAANLEPRRLLTQPPPSCWWPAARAGAGAASRLGHGARHRLPARQGALPALGTLPATWGPAAS